MFAPFFDGASPPAPSSADFSAPRFCLASFASSSSSTGYSCSALSYLREMGRKMCSAARWVRSTVESNFFGSSRLIAMALPYCAVR